MHKFLSLDLQEIRTELLTKKFVRSSEVLGPTEEIFVTKEHGYRHIGDPVFLHVMSFEAGQPYRLKMGRKGLVCVQINIKGAYSRLVGDRTDLVSPAMIHITNSQRSVVDAEAGTKFRGLLLVCDREYLLDQYAVNVDRLPTPYRLIFTSDVGVAEVMQLPNSQSTISIADQIISCKLTEPLRSHYLRAKTIELICDIVLQINTHATQRPIRLRTSLEKSQAIETAANIYRREVSRPPTIEQLALRVGLNRNDLTNGFRDMFGTTPHYYGLMRRMERAEDLLRDGTLSISEIARRVGYEGYSSFSRAYHAHYGHAPAQSEDQPIG
ncbi:MAG: AraC family transcriptional regulator [Rhizobiaceae bacterium]|nr:AraC family transcriptional regulator [Rhizobiaceae bacterium]